MTGLVLFLLLLVAAFVVTQASVLVGRNTPAPRYTQPERTKAELQAIYSVTLPSYPMFATRV